MATRKARDESYLERKAGKYRVVVAVPRSLHKALGTKLKRELHTDSLSLANKLKWGVVRDFKQRIEDAKAGKAHDSLTREALSIAALRSIASDPEELEHLRDAASMRADEILGDPVAEFIDPETGSRVLEYDPDAERKATVYHRMASGTDIPLGFYHQQYLGQSLVKLRTKRDDVRALGFLEAWCSDNGVAPVVQAITRKRAAAFRDDLGGVASGRTPVTLTKYLNRLSRYWAWMLEREHAKENPWRDLRALGANRTVPDEEKERAFTVDEMARLLRGQSTSHMHDLMRIAALTGARLDAIVDLKVGDCANGSFWFKRQKKETARRFVPTHPQLVEIVERRTKGKVPEDDLFPEWPAPKKQGSQRERSFKASNAFTDYRRSVGVDERIPGGRRSLVNFHSFRRWFITEAERAGQPEHIIAIVVGHKRKGVTLGTYSGGPAEKQVRRCVEAVRLPKGSGT